MSLVSGKPYDNLSDSFISELFFDGLVGMSCQRFLSGLELT